MDSRGIRGGRATAREKIKQRGREQMCGTTMEDEVMDEEGEKERSSRRAIYVLPRCQSIAPALCVTSCSNAPSAFTTSTYRKLLRKL
jgi:hypothetical protein